MLDWLERTAHTPSFIPVFLRSGEYPHCLSHRWSPVGILVGLCQPLALLVRLGFGPSDEGTTHFYNSLDFDITCRQARVAQTGAPITEQKDAFAAEGCCACVYLYRRTFLVTC